MISKTYIVLFILFLHVIGHADHPVHSPQDLKKWGFKKYTPKPLISAFSLPQNLAPQDLPFPIALQFPVDQFGALMHQYQDWTTPAYFHAGLDIRGTLHQEVFAPVYGTIEGGYYSYTDSFDGRSEKYFLSYNEVAQGNSTPPWGELYFELAITDRNGYRYELHHIDAKTLPDTIIDKISNGGSVAPGEFLGVLVEWPLKLFDHVYHHVHYNVISPDGIYLNPFIVSEPVADSISPVIVNISATKQSSCGTGYPHLIPLNSESPTETQGDVVVEAYDQIQEGKARQMPTVIRAEFEGQAPFSWDFSQSLVLQNGAHPDITKIYLYYLCDEKNWLQVATRSFRFYIKVPVPPNYSGPVIITAEDGAGNQTTKKVLIKPVSPLESY